MKNILKKSMSTFLTVVLLIVSLTINVSAEQYTAKAGDSWYRIASKYDITATDLAAANNMKIDQVLLKGKILTIPLSGNNNSSKSNTTNSSSGEYIVKAGDSWYRIAKKFGTTASKLAEINGKTVNAVIIPGEKLQIASSENTNSSSGSAIKNSGEYTVKSGDSWYRIAKNYGISAIALAKANGRSLNNVILVGEKINIPSTTTSNSSGNQNNAEVDNQAKSSYTVQQGDSWYSISRKFSVTTYGLAKINGRTINDTIFPGEKLAIPTKSGESHDFTSGGVKSAITLYTSTGTASWTNIKLAATKLNGLTLTPGKVFSWAEVMGPCGKDQGYVLAGAYSNGKPSTAYGGGICFVSTCLMQAARAANLQILEKHDHSLPVKYASRGNEASVSYGSWDLKFKNTTNETLVFTTSISSNGALTIYCSSAS